MVQISNRENCNRVVFALMKFIHLTLLIIKKYVFFVWNLKSKADIQKRVVEHVKSVIRPFYSKGRINKDEYKEIMRKTVPKVS